MDSIRPGVERVYKQRLPGVFTVVFGSAKVNGQVHYQSDQVAVPANEELVVEALGLLLSYSILWGQPTVVDPEMLWVAAQAAQGHTVTVVLKDGGIVNGYLAKAYEHEAVRWITVQVLREEEWSLQEIAQIVVLV